MTALLTTATVKYGAKTVNTKHGERSNAVITLPSGEEVTIWGNTNSEVSGLRKGEQVQLVNINGKWKLAENAPITPASNSNGTAKPQPQPMTAEQKRLVAEYVTEQSNLLAYCIEQAHKALVSKFPNQSFPVESEAVRSAGLTLYIAAQKRFSL